MNRAIISDIFENKSNRKALFSPKYRGKVLEVEVAEAAEEEKGEGSFIVMRK